jgi:hypothetical protein
MKCSPHAASPWIFVGQEDDRNLRQFGFPLSIEMARHAGRNWALLGGNALLSLIPYVAMAWFV